MRYFTGQTKRSLEVDALLRKFQKKKRKPRHSSNLRVNWLVLNHEKWLTWYKAKGHLEDIAQRKFKEIYAAMRDDGLYVKHRMPTEWSQIALGFMTSALEQAEAQAAFELKCKEEDAKDLCCHAEAPIG